MLSRALGNTFLITSLGRSATKFLAQTIHAASDLYAVHEWQISGVWSDSRLERFPTARFFLGALVCRRYGEVNSYLRRFLSPRRKGPERHIPRKAILIRDPRDVIASSMNRGGRDGGDFESQCSHILDDYNKLLAIQKCRSDEFRAFDFERYTADADYIVSIMRWLGASKIVDDVIHIDGKINTNDGEWFPYWRDWDQSLRKTYRREVRECVDESFRSSDSEWPGFEW